jgi:hypothetical protein
MKKVSGWIVSRFSALKGELRDSQLWIKVSAIAVGAYLLFALFLGIYWSFEPDVFDVEANTQQRLQSKQPVVGTHTTAALIGVVDTMLDKPGGFISNDVSPPGIWLDNIPAWEYGVLIQVRDLTKSMRDNFSRSQTQSTEDKSLANADAQFNFDHTSWLLPSTEGEYEEGLVHLEDYLARLVDGDDQNGQFYSRADNLAKWLDTVETRLGSLSQRLSASVGQKRVNTDLAGEPVGSNSTQRPSELAVKTPWTEIDDVFYEARGSSWALIQFLKAVEVDFADVLEKKNARVSMQQIIRELEGTQQQIYSPMILNGDGFGFLANHSLVMASYISRANAAIIDLRQLLTQG